MAVILDTLKKPAYAAIALAVSFLMFSFSVWLRNLGLLKDIIASPALGLTDKLLFFLNGLGAIATNVTIFSALLIVAASLLFGINISLFVHYIATRRKLPKKEGAGVVAAFVSGVLGVGCASCGSLILGSLLASIGAAGLIAFLPLRGQEFSILSVVLLIFSIKWVANGINAQSKTVCEP